jgi:hypothetical protein
MAEPFGKKQRADMDVLVAACLLHDAHSFNKAAPKDHELRSAMLAERLLKKLKFPKKKIPLVKAAIMDHRSDAHGQRSVEGDILKSFDKLDAFGPMGVYRIIAPLSIRGYGAEDIAGWALDEKKLDRKWRAIAFPELRKQYRSRFLYTKKYFTDLRKALGKQTNHRRVEEGSVYAR